MSSVLGTRCKEADSRTKLTTVIGHHTPHTPPGRKVTGTTYSLSLSISHSQDFITVYTAQYLGYPAKANQVRPGKSRATMRRKNLSSP